MVRSTVARVDRRAEGLRRDSAPSVPTRQPSLESSRPTRTVTARRASRSRCEEAGATMLACADIEEGIALRQAGVHVPILVFGALSVSDLDGLFDFALTPTISTPGAARAVQAAAERRRTTIAYHLKIDTGMNRLGFRHDNLRRTLPELLGSPQPDARRRLHALRVGRRAGESASSATSVTVRGAGASCGSSSSRRARMREARPGVSSRVQQRGAAS